NHRQFGVIGWGRWLLALQPPVTGNDPGEETGNPDADQQSDFHGPLIMQGRRSMSSRLTSQNWSGNRAEQCSALRSAEHCSACLPKRRVAVSSAENRHYLE